MTSLDWPGNFMHCVLIIEWLGTIQSLTMWKLRPIFWIFDIEWCRVFAAWARILLWRLDRDKADSVMLRERLWSTPPARYHGSRGLTGLSAANQRPSLWPMDQWETRSCPLPSPSQTASDSSEPLTWKLDIQWTHLHKILHFRIEPWPRSLTGISIFKFHFKLVISPDSTLALSSYFPDWNQFIRKV